ncbi:MAG: hypothetical protein K8I30_03350 [Anaerolineae bacterium]|nr:hypothetical protein [Anaerolineae bacterium]
MSANPLAPRSPRETEYASLRDEILRRQDARQQTLSVAMTLAGAFLGIGWNAGPVVLLLYPLIALLLAVSWAQNEVFIKQINAYIRERLEGDDSGLGWQSYSAQRGSELRIMGWPIEILAIGGIFVLTQLMAIGLGTYQFQGGSIQWILLILDVAAVVALGGLMEYVRRRSLI